MIKLYVFGMNYNPLTREEEEELTEIKIPAKTEEEARSRLSAMVGWRMARRCLLNDVREY